MWLFLALRLTFINSFVLLLSPAGACSSSARGARSIVARPGGLCSLGLTTWVIQISHIRTKHQSCGSCGRLWRAVGGCNQWRWLDGAVPRSRRLNYPSPQPPQSFVLACQASQNSLRDITHKAKPGFERPGGVLCYLLRARGLDAPGWLMRGSQGSFLAYQVDPRSSPISPACCR